VTYAAASGPAAVTARELADVTAEVFGTTPAVLLPAGASDEVVRNLFAEWQRGLTGHGRTVMGIYEPYLTVASRFESCKGDQLMVEAGVPRFDPRTVLARCLEYARTTDFGRLHRAQRRTARAPSAA